MLKFVVCLLLLVPVMAHAGEADSPEQALHIVADKIEAGDLAGALQYFPDGSGKNEEALKMITGALLPQRQQLAESFRHATLKQVSTRQYTEGPRLDYESRDYTMPSVTPDGARVETNMTVCGSGRDWYVCNW